MMKLRSLLAAVVIACGLVAAPSGIRAQEAHAAPAKEAPGPADIIMPHITDSKHIEYPCYRNLQEWSCEHTFATRNVTIGGKTFDMGFTKHVFFLFVAGAATLILLVGVAISHKRHSSEVGRPRGFAAGIEAVILYLRNEIYLPVLGGHGGERYVPFCLSLFFFILWCNLLGLMPWGSTPTGNVAVTATLAVITFIVVEIAGIKTQGIGYLNTIFYWNKDLPMVMRILMFPLMSIVEIVGKLTKPFALAIRLFANMTAGHIVVLALIGLIFTFRSIASGAPLLMAIAIMVLELFVALLQAYIFTLLSSVFIGLIREGGH